MRVADIMKGLPSEHIVVGDGKTISAYQIYNHEGPDQPLTPGGFVGVDVMLDASQSHDGRLVLSGGWIGPDARIYDNARISGKPKVLDYAEIFGNARVCNHAKIFGHAKIHGHAKVSRYAWISGKAQIFGNARVCGNAEIYDNAKVFGYSKVFGNAEIFGNALIRDHSKIFDNTMIYGDSDISGFAQFFEYAQAFGGARVSGAELVFGNQTIDRPIGIERTVDDLTSPVTVSEKSECSICYSEFQPQAQLAEVKKCKHIFHRDCIRDWFAQSKTCPLCRASLN